MAFYLCLLSFAVSYLIGRRSLVGGLVVVFAVGYSYGIIRANLPDTYSHFIFDAGVVGLYFAQLFRPLSPLENFRTKHLRSWLELLIAWPLVLFIFPIQDYLIQIVGLRGSIFLLPFLFLGARLEPEERYRLAIWIAVLNLLAFAVASAEFFWGLEAFFPHNKMTALIYISKDLVRHSSYRIPSSFANAHAYGGTMVVTLPLLIGALVQERRRDWHMQLLMVAIGATFLGVFMSAARTHFIVAVILTLVATFSLRSRFGYALGWLILLCGVGWIVSGEDRLQRFMELKNTDMIAERISWSVNMSFVDLAAKYPFGNGLGGGGTSIPYFLHDRMGEPVVMENEYARIMLEQGLLGLAIWIAFVVWVLSRRNHDPTDAWFLGRRLAWVTSASFFLIAITGTGLLTSVPQTCIFLLVTGWAVARQPVGEEKLALATSTEVEDTAQFPEQQYG